MKKLFLLACLMLPVSAHAQSAPEQIVEPTWGQYQMNWATGSSTYLRHAVINHNGKYAVCLAVTTRGRVPSKLTREVLRRAKMTTSQGTDLRQNLQFARIHGSAKFSSKLVGEVAYCRATSVDFNDQDARSRLEIPQGRYSFEK